MTDQSNLNYPVKANIEIETMKVWSNRNLLVPAGTFGRDQIKKKRISWSGIKWKSTLNEI